MKLAKKAFIYTLILLTLIVTVTAQTTTNDNARSDKDPRNTAPTVGTGGPPGGPTGLFTVYDGQTLRRGEFTFSAAWSNYDRDPGNVDISEVPVSFQIGVTDSLELWFNTDAYRAVKVNSPRNLSGFYLPNAGLGGINLPAIVAAPRGSGTAIVTGPIFRPAGAPFVPFPFVGGNAGNFGFTTVNQPGPLFGFTSNLPTLGPPTDGGSGADNFPGIGSIYGSILPGIVLTTRAINNTGSPTAPASRFLTIPTVFTLAPSYLPDAPFISRTYGESSFSTFTVGAKWRITSPNNPVGIGIIPFYRFYADQADDASGFNQLQRGASPGGGGLFSGGRGDIGLVVFGDARLRKWINVSGNVGYIYNSSVKGEFNGTEFTLLDRPNELMGAVAVDFPVNKYFQPIFEFRGLAYVGGRTPNAFENNPLDGIAGVRFFPRRWLSIGVAYRHHFNDQDTDSFDDGSSNSVTFGGTINSSAGTITQNFSGLPPGFIPSDDPHGFIIQFTAGRRDARKAEVENIPANVESVTLGETRVTRPCPPGQRPVEGQNCSDDMSVSVTTVARDAENDVLTYNYTVSGGRVTGQGANVTWDLSGVAPGTYTITAGVDDGCGVCGATKTQTITVEDCRCEEPPRPCICPTVDVTGPSGVTRPGESMTFTANVGGASGGDVTYNWTVSSGTISNGQGSPVITVDTTGLAGGSNVTATVTIGGNNFCTDCTPSDSETAGIQANPEARLIDTIGAATNDDIKARLEGLRNELGADPNARGYIINYGTARQIAARERQLQQAITFLGIDASRVTIVRGGDRGAGIETQVYIVPSGAENPTP
jgi:hypothetical protein